MMNTMSRSILVGAALAMLLVGCQKQDDPASTSRMQSLPSASNTTATSPQTATPDPSLPKAAAMAAGTQDPTSLQRKANPQGRMTKEEESKAMPLPSQANDHSTTALDKNKGK